ncbi:MAG TPA: class I SAM-dependent methyltransferase [Lacunisphaera sp.]
MKFDRLAPHYDWLEAFTAGQRLQRARTQWLDELAGCRHVLSVGEGHGRFAAAFLARFPEARLTCLEASPGMIAVGKQRVRAWADRVHWEQADALTWSPTQPYDAVVTCFFLDCFPPDALASVVKRLADSTAPSAKWLVTDFAVPVSGAARWRARAVHALMYAFFRVAVALPARRLTNPDDLLAAHGFRLTHRREFEWGLVRSELWRRCDRNAEGKMPFS